jgi:hypothetical protein
LVSFQGHYNTVSFLPPANGPPHVKDNNAVGNEMSLKTLSNFGGNLDIQDLVHPWPLWNNRSLIHFWEMLTPLVEGRMLWTRMSTPLKKEGRKDIALQTQQ